MQEDLHVLGTEHPLKRPSSPASTSPTDKKPRSSNEAGLLSEKEGDDDGDTATMVENAASDAVPLANESSSGGGYDADPNSKSDDGNANEDPAVESDAMSADPGEGSDDDYDENVDAEEESEHEEEEMGNDASDSDRDDAVDKVQSARAQAEHRRGLGLRAAPTEVEHFGVPAASVDDLRRSRGRPVGARTGEGIGAPAAVSNLGSSAKHSLRHFAYTNEQDLQACLLVNETGDRRALPVYTPTPRPKPSPPIGYANQLAWCTAWGASEDPSRPVADDCCVCGLSDFAPGNDVLFCGDGAASGCDGAFHQQCYGVSVVPEGDWYCRTCLSQTPVPPEPVPVAKVVDAAKNSAVSPSKKAVASARSDRDDDDDDEDDDDDFETSVQDSAEEAVKSSEEAGSLQPATAAGSATAQDEVDETAAAAAAADVEWLTTLQLAASVRGSDAIADGAKLRALDLAAAAAAEGNASEVEACATASNSHNNSSNGSAGPAAEASALEAMSTCHEFVSLCAFFDRFQWPAVGHGHLALALAPDAAARVGGGGEGGEGSGSSAGKAAAVAAQSSSTFSAEFLGGLAASMLARVQGKPASAYPAEKWEAALSAALQYMDERDGATLEEAEKEDDDNHDSNGNGKRLGKESEMGSEGATKGEHDATWLAELSGGSRVEVKLSDGEWVKGTIARLYKSTGRADVTLDPAAGNKDDNSDVDDDEEVVVDEEHGVDRTKLRPPSASAFTPGAEPATNLSSSSSSSSSSSTDATPQPLLLSMRPFDRARALSRLVDETLTFPPPDLLGALRTLAKEAPEALRDAPLGFDRLGRGYYYLEDHVGGILVVRTSPSKLPPLVAPLSTSLSDNAGGAKTDANAGDKKTKGKSEAATAPGKGAGKSKGGGAKGGGAGTFAWSAKAAKKKLAEEAAAAKAIAKSAADAVAAAVARREELLASLEAQDDNTGDTSQNDGTLISSSSSSGNKDGSRNILSGSSSSSSSSTSRGRSEVLCSGEAGVQALIAALATTQDPSELWLWRNLSQEVLPRLAALAAEKVRLEKKAERGQRRLAKANKELERLSSRMDSVDEHGGGGGRSRGRGGKVDYTFSSYDRAMKDATRDW